MRHSSPVAASVLAFVICCVGCLEALADTVQFTDGTFNPTDWSLTVFTTGNGGSVNVSQELSGGNPGAYREIINHVNSSPTVQSSVIGFNFKAGAVYTPLTQGAIDTIDYSEDNFITVLAGAGQGAGPALRQNGNYYLIAGLNADSVAWDHHELDDQTALNFVQYLNASAHPDFSATGSAIEFGFFRSNSGVANGGGAFTRTGGIDNWSFTITNDASPVPLPAAAWAGLILMTALATNSLHRTWRLARLR